MSKRSDLTPSWIYRLMIASIALGIALRFLWTHDMEYKGDEQYMFYESQTVGISQPWPWLGMPSGAGPRNPGMSIWIFVALAKIFQITTPIGLVHAVIALNCLALIALGIMAVRHVPSASSPNEKESWMWAAVIASVNPIGIQLQRKIWAQSVLPIFCVAFLASWLKRDKKSGAFFWGFFGAILGQIHMSGFFFALAFVIWSLFKAETPKKPRWRFWFAGSAVGSISLIPWLHYMITSHERARLSSWWDLFRPTYWIDWVLQSIGMPLSESIGGSAFRELLGAPYFWTIPSYGVALLHLLAILAGASAIVIDLASIKVSGMKNPGALFWGKANESARAQNAGLFGFGIAMLLGRIQVYRHYLLVAFPLPQLWLSRMALAKPHWGRRLLFVLALAQLGISIAFLEYIHVKGGSPSGDYGVAYSAQHPNQP